MPAPTEYDSYFQHRLIRGDGYARGTLPHYLVNRLPPDKAARILDFGCGFGQTVRELQARGHAGAIGFDIEPAAIAYCRLHGIPVIDGTETALSSQVDQYDLILASHVLEHLPKDIVISTLADLRRRLLPSGRLLACVPNAQSHTGAYWAFEDFTHHTVFTSGSLFYVLSKAGFSGIEIIDRDCTEGQGHLKRFVRRVLMSLYRCNYRFWNMVTASATHAPSPDVLSYEVKAIARP